MKDIKIVLDCDFNVVESKYDVFIAASGYETRCTHIANTINIANFQKVIVLGFNDFANSEQRKINDNFYNEKNIQIKKIIDDAELYALLGEIKISDKDSLKILIDYSSMPRNWYNAIISFFKFQNSYRDIEIVFGYSLGEYPKHFENFIIDEISSMEGLEGSDIFNEKSIALFGIGYDSEASLCVYDQLEPDIIHIMATDGVNDGKAQKLNSELIANTVNKVQIVPLRSVEQIFRSLGELITGYINNSHITLIPMGPKPFTLASILISHRFHQISCLHVKGHRSIPHENIKAKGPIVFTKVVIS